MSNTSAPVTEATRLYPKLTTDTADGAIQYRPEDFVPSRKTVLVKLFPKIEKIGEILIPDQFQQESSLARVVAVHPEETEYEVNMIVMLRKDAGTIVPFSDGTKPEKDAPYVLVQYSDDLDSEILGQLRAPDTNQEKLETAAEAS